MNSYVTHMRTCTSYVETCTPLPQPIDHHCVQQIALHEFSKHRFTVTLLSVCCYCQGLITEGVQCDVTHTTSLTIPALSTQQFAVDVVPTGDGLLKMMGRSFLALVNV